MPTPAPDPTLAALACAEAKAQDMFQLTPFYATAWDGDHGFLPLYEWLTVSASSTGPLSVDTLVDEDDGNTGTGDLSLREAIGIAQTTGQDIVFDPSLAGGILRLDAALGAITITGGSFTVDGNADGDAAGRPDIFITGDTSADDMQATSATGFAVTDAAANNNNESDNIRLFSISGTTTDVTFQSLGLTGGASNNGGAILLQTEAQLLLDMVTVEGNVSSNRGGGIYNDDASLTLTNTTLAGNETALEGGGVFSDTSSAGTGTWISNSTLTGNAADAGGGFYNLQGDARLANSTLTLNVANAGAGAVSEGTPGPATEVVSTLIAGNSGAADVSLFFGGTNSFVSGGNNLIGADDEGLFTHGTTGDQVGSSASPLDPLLRALALNGGASASHLPQASSLAADAGANPDGLSADQTAGARVRDAAIDVGAAETRPLPDLTASSFSATNLSPFLGETVTFSWEMTNTGTGDAAGFLSALYLSADSTVTADDLRLGSLGTFGGLAAGASTSLSLSFALEGAIAPGLYTAAVLGDDPNSLSETSETNNTSNTLAIDLTTAAPVTLGTGSSTVAGYATLTRALDMASANAEITVIAANYSADPETALVRHNDITITLAAGLSPLITLDAGLSTLTLSGSGTPWITANASANQLTGGDGDDTLTGLAGADTLDGGTGQNTADYAHSTARVLIDLALGTASGGDAEGDILLNIQGLIGSPFNDFLAGGSAADHLRGGEAADNISGRAGDDRLLGGDGADLISGGNDNDWVEGGAADDLLFGNGGHDTLQGGAALDTLFGGAGNDRLEGGGGQDEVSGQGGADTLLGGSDRDTLRGGSGNDSLEGGDGNDMLFGNGNNDTISGEAGHDQLQGAAGADLLRGGAGDDTLTGGNGGDRLDGGTGRDVMNGGGADGVRDVFVFSAGYGQDRINAFDQTGTDQIHLDEALWLSTHPGGLTRQQVVDTFGTLNPTGSILTLDFGSGDILEVQNGAGIDPLTLGSDLLIV